MPRFHCEGDANWFIERYFLDCIYNTRDLAGFTFGMASIACWLVAQVPQFITNIKRQRADALSPWFLAEWLMHRRERLASIPRQRLSPDDPLYRHAVRRPASIDEESGTMLLPQQSSTSSRSSGKASRVLACLAVLMLVQSQWPMQQSLPLDQWRSSLTAQDGSRHLFALDALGPALPQGAVGAAGNADRPDWVRKAGTIIGWSSSGFYLGSRFSQIWKNHSRRSAEGLSLAMFACAISANVCYGLGILIRAYSWQVIWSSAPWILGSLGTVTLDMVIFTQGVLYASKRPPVEAALPAEESQPLSTESSNAHSS